MKKEKEKKLYIKVNFVLAVNGKNSRSTRNFAAVEGRNPGQITGMATCVATRFSIRGNYKY